MRGYKGGVVSSPIVYTVGNLRALYRDYQGTVEQLTATTDRGARTQAKRIAKAKGWGEYSISFFRSSGCRGNIDP